MKVTYLSHMGSDLEVVNDARVSFGATSEWQEWGDGLYDYGRTLKVSDQRLIAFLARGCTIGDWAHYRDLLIEAVTHKRYKTSIAEMRDRDHTVGEEVDALIREIKKMPTHWTPFAGSIIKLHVKLPIFLANQFKRSEQGRVYNEISRRYVDDPPEFYEPEVWRKRAENVKQGSSDESVDLEDHTLTMSLLDYRNETLGDAYDDFRVGSQGLYEQMIAAGVCPEQARMVLPQSTYTELRVTGSLYYWSRLYVQRADPHAQREWETITKQLDEIIEPLFPVSWKELTR